MNDGQIGIRKGLLGFGSTRSLGNDQFGGVAAGDGKVVDMVVVRKRVRTNNRSAIHLQHT